jgi:hypothetical protein
MRPAYEIPETVTVEIAPAQNKTNHVDTDTPRGGEFRGVACYVFYAIVPKLGNYGQRLTVPQAWAPDGIPPVGSEVTCTIEVERKPDGSFSLKGGKTGETTWEYFYSVKQWLPNGSAPVVEQTVTIEGDTEYNSDGQIVQLNAKQEVAPSKAKEPRTKFDIQESDKQANINKSVSGNQSAQIMEITALYCAQQKLYERADFDNWADIITEKHIEKAKQINKELYQNES